MEDTTSAAFNATNSRQSPNCINNNELNNAEHNIDDCQQQHRRQMKRQKTNGRWCTSSVRSRSSTSFLIHNLLISRAQDMPKIASPPPLIPSDGHDNEDCTSRSSSSTSTGNKSRSCSPRDMLQPSSPVLNVHDDGKIQEEEEEVDGKYNSVDRYRMKRRKCANPFRRMRSVKNEDSESANDASDNSDNNVKRESKHEFFAFYKRIKILTIYIDEHYNAILFNETYAYIYIYIYRGDNLIICLLVYLYLILIVFFEFLTNLMVICCLTRLLFRQSNL